MKKLIPVLLLALLGTACDDLQGTLSVQSPLTLKTKKETIVLQPGAVSAKLDLDEGDRELEIKVKNAAGKEKEAKLKIPAGMAIPKFSGTLDLKAAQTGQAFDLKGAIDTDVDEGPSIDTTESCSYTREVVRYRWVEVKDPRTGKIRRHRESYTEYETVYGTREVRYHNKHTTVTGKAEFIEPANGSLLATFNGSRSWSETIYEYQGRCW